MQLVWKQVKVPDKHTATEQENQITILTITRGQAEGYYIDCMINSMPVKMQLDAGAAALVMSDQQ